MQIDVNFAGVNGWDSAQSEWFNGSGGWRGSSYRCYCGSADVSLQVDRVLLWEEYVLDGRTHSRAVGYTIWQQAGWTKGNLVGILITSEWPYCAYPLVVEVYNFCYHDCVYCFTKHKETWHNKAKQRRERGFRPHLDILDLTPIRRMLAGCPPVNRNERILKGFLDKRLTIQVGAQTDPGGHLEHQHSRTYELLSLLRNEGGSYPVRLSTKGTAFGEPRYLDLLREYGNAIVLLSFASFDENLVRRIEPSAASVSSRLALAGKLAGCGVPLGLRLRPILPNLSDDSMERMIRDASNSGFQWITVEWLRVPRTLTRESRRNFKNLSAATGTDIIAYYRANSDLTNNHNGFLRLRPEVLLSQYERLAELCRMYRLPLASCNKDFRCYQTFTPNCCGASLSDRNWSRMQLSFAVHIAKIKGTVQFSDIYDANSPLNALRNRDNDCDRYLGKTYGETLLEIWNDPTHRYYPANFFMELEYDTADGAGSHVFRYVGIDKLRKRLTPVECHASLIGG